MIRAILPADIVSWARAIRQLAPLSSRRYSQEPHQQGIYTNYSSEMDYLVRYQLNHMFFRYLFWNYIGAAGDEQDAGVSWKDTWGIPFLDRAAGHVSPFQEGLEDGACLSDGVYHPGPVLALYQKPAGTSAEGARLFLRGGVLCPLNVDLHGDPGPHRLRAQVSVRREDAASPRRRHRGIFSSLPFLPILSGSTTMNTTARAITWHGTIRTICSSRVKKMPSSSPTGITIHSLSGTCRMLRSAPRCPACQPESREYLLVIHQMKNTPYYKEAIAVPISIADSRIDNIGPQLWEPRKMQLPVPGKCWNTMA